MPRLQITADPGNLIYRERARNFGPVMATAATLTIAEVSRVDEGEVPVADCFRINFARLADPLDVRLTKGVGD